MHAVLKKNCEVTIRRQWGSVAETLSSLYDTSMYNQLMDICVHNSYPQAVQATVTKVYPQV